jgi:hypothetical protein
MSKGSKQRPGEGYQDNWERIFKGNKEEPKDKYVYQTFGTARFQIDAGMYSIEELEHILENLKDAKQQRDKYLKSSIGR